MIAGKLCTHRELVGDCNDAGTAIGPIRLTYTDSHAQSLMCTESRAHTRSLQLPAGPSSAAAHDQRRRHALELHEACRLRACWTQVGLATLPSPVLAGQPFVVMLPLKIPSLYVSVRL